MFWQTQFSQLNDIINIFGVESINKTVQDMFAAFFISVPLSLLLYLIFSRYRHWTLVDLGDHKWLIK